MTDQKDFSKAVAQAIEEGKLGDVSGGLIVHKKSDEAGDEWVVFPDVEIVPTPGPGPAYQHIEWRWRGEKSGPYKSEEEAIEAAKNSGCTHTNVIEWENRFKTMGPIKPTKITR